MKCVSVCLSVCLSVCWSAGVCGLTRVLGMRRRSAPAEGKSLVHGELPERVQDLLHLLWRLLAALQQGTSQLQWQEQAKDFTEMS